MSIITQEELTKMSELVFTKNLTSLLTPYETLPFLFYKYPAANLTKFYNVTVDLMTRFTKYAVPCISYGTEQLLIAQVKEKEKKDGDAEEIEPWNFVNRIWYVHVKQNYFNPLFYLQCVRNSGVSFNFEHTLSCSCKNE